MQIVLWVLSVALLVPSPFPWYASWIITSAVLIIVAAVRMTSFSDSLWILLSKSCGRGSDESKDSATEEPLQLESS